MADTMRVAIGVVSITIGAGGHIGRSVAYERWVASRNGAAKRFTSGAATVLSNDSGETCLTVTAKPGRTAGRQGGNVVVEKLLAIGLVLAFVVLLALLRWWN